MTRSGLAPAFNWLLRKKPGLVLVSWPRLGWRKQVCEEKSQDRLSPGRRLRQTQMLCSDWSAAGNPGLWLVSTLAWSWPRVTLVHGWDAGAGDPRLPRDEMPQIRPEMTHYTHYTHALWARNKQNSVPVCCQCTIYVKTQHNFKLKSPYNVTTGVWTFRNPSHSHIRNMQCIDKFST